MDTFIYGNMIASVGIIRTLTHYKMIDVFKSRVSACVWKYL